MIGNILALDIGDKRIGLAIAHTVSQLARPLTTLTNDQTVLAAIKEIIERQSVVIVVVGLPRNMAGAETRQSLVARDFAKKIQSQLDLPLVFVDETLSTVQAEERLKHAKDKTIGIDAWAATVILEDYLSSKEVMYV